MDRRTLNLSLLALVFASDDAAARGHNQYCTFRDNGGHYLSDKGLLVVGSGYPQTLAAVPRNARPITMLVETRAQYTRALADIHAGRPGIPKGSVAVFDFTSDPDPALEQLDRPLGRVRIVHDIPRTLEEARAIHGPFLDESHYHTALPTLTALRKRLEARGALDLTLATGASVQATFERLVESTAQSEMIVYVGHREEQPRKQRENLARYRLQFHDGTSYDLEKTLAAKCIVWAVSCETWTEVATLLSHRPSGSIAIGTTAPITYSDGVGVAEDVADSRTPREAISKVQRRHRLSATAASPASSAGPNASSPAHRTERPAEAYMFMVELNPGRGIGTAAATLTG